MAMSPAPRARQRRAINVEVEVPATPDHVRFARDYVIANTAKNLAGKDEKVAHEKLWSAMAQAVPPITTFDITEGNKTYRALIAAPDEAEIDVAQLYAMVGTGEITLAQFLETISATQTNVKKVLGSNVLAKVKKTSAGKDKLTVKEVK